MQSSCHNSIANFNPRAPQGARRVGITGTHEAVGFQSTRSARSATSPILQRALLIDISIHALRKERDISNPPACASYRHFNPRAPQGARPTAGSLYSVQLLFQSTRSARSATELRPRDVDSWIFQSTRSARSATLPDIFAPQLLQFQSTRSARSATPVDIVYAQFRHISIHALRKERDVGTIRSMSARTDFNPRAPQGARPMSFVLPTSTQAFQSTRSARSATG